MKALLLTVACLALAFVLRLCDEIASKHLKTSNAQPEKLSYYRDLMD